MRALPAVAHDLVGIRGPYGNGFPVEEMEGQDLLIVAGGLGMAPLRSLLWYALDHRERFGRDHADVRRAHAAGDVVSRRAGSLTEVDGITTLLTVDRDPDGGWKHHVGLLPELFTLARSRSRPDLRGRRRAAHRLSVRAARAAGPASRRTASS
jgi:NAD(P)H-flavin reductase